MTQPEGRAMKCGIFEQIIPGDFRGNSKKVRILSLKKSVEKEKESRVKILPMQYFSLRSFVAEHKAPLVSTKNRLHEFLVDHACALRCSGMVGKSNYGTQIYRTENWLE